MGLALASQYLIQFNALTYIKDLYPYYQPHSPGYFEILISSFMTLIPVLFLQQKTSPASSAAWIYYVYIYLSSASIGITVHNSLISYIFYTLYLLTGIIVISFVGSIQIQLNLKKIKLNRLDKLYFIVCFILSLLAWHFASYDIQWRMDDVYERRLETRNSMGFAGYLLALLRLLFPVLAMYALVFKQSVRWLLIVAAGCIGIFSYDGTKSSILYFLLFGIFAVGIKQNRLPLWLLTLVVVINLFAPIENILTGKALILDSLVRRAFVLPGWSSSFFWSFDPDSTCLRNITYEVGYELFGNELSNENTNFMMWGWAWAGWLGGLLMAFCAGAIISVFNYVPKMQFPNLGALMAAGTVLIWSEQFLHTSMLSSGVALLVLTALLFRLSPTGWSYFRQNTKIKACRAKNSKIVI